MGELQLITFLQHTANRLRVMVAEARRADLPDSIINQLNDLAENATATINQWDKDQEASAIAAGDFPP